MPLRILIFALFLTAMNVFAQAPTIETGVPQTLARWRAANYSDVRYKLNLTLEKQSPTLKGTIEISLKNNADQIILDWRKIRGKEDFSKVENVFINGKSANYEEVNEHLVFKDGVTKGENVIKLNFTSPILTSGSAITRYVDKEDGTEYIYSLFVPSDASTAFPVFDQPDLKAKFKLIAKYPKGWKIVTNAKPVSGNVLDRTENSIILRGGLDKTPPELSKDGFVSQYFEETKPISTYVFAFAAGEFTQFNDESKTGRSPRVSKGADDSANSNLDEKSTPLLTRGLLPSSAFVRKSQAEKFKQHAAETFRLNREAVKYLAEYFDYQFPFPKYDLVLIPEFPFGGMEHAGATFLREDRIIFPTEPTKNDFVTRANLIFHEAAHQWFGDTVTMRWFDDLWLKEGFAEFMAYKTLERVMPEYNAWKIFYERNKQAAYLTDSTKGTTPIYQEIPNLNSAKSAYGNIVYRKAPSFLKQAEFYLGADKFQTAVRQFLKKHQLANAEWTDLVKEFELASGQDLKDWANIWVKQRGLAKITVVSRNKSGCGEDYFLEQTNNLDDNALWKSRVKVLILSENADNRLGFENGKRILDLELISEEKYLYRYRVCESMYYPHPKFIFPNYQDYGYGIFLLDEKSRAYILANIQNETDDFLRTMMWGALWDSVREAELAPQDYVELVVKNINVEADESTIQTLLNRVSTAMNYYLSDEQRETLAPKVEAVLIDKMQKAETLGQRITFYRAFLNVASSEKARLILKDIKSDKFKIKDLRLKLKDRYDILIRLGILGDKDATEEIYEKYGTHAMDKMSDEERRYAFASGASIADAEIKKYYFDNFVNNKNISENWVEAAFVPFNSTRHAELTLPYLEKALAELPNLKRTRKIFFVNGWLGAFIEGQKSEQALAIVNKFLADNPALDKDLRLKILENADGLERAVKIRGKFSAAK